MDWLNKFLAHMWPNLDKVVYSLNSHTVHLSVQLVFHFLNLT